MGGVLWSTSISMETRPRGLMWVFHLGSSCSCSLNRGTQWLQGRSLGLQSWGQLTGSDQRAQQLGQHWLGLWVRAQGGQLSRCPDS